jgi:hypothetical protein
LTRLDLLEPEILLDRLHESGAQVLLLAVHRQNRHPVATPNDEVSASPGSNVQPCLFSQRLNPALVISLREYNEDVAEYNTSVSMEICPG